MGINSTFIPIGLILMAIILGVTILWKINQYYSPTTYPEYLANEVKNGKVLVIGMGVCKSCFENFFQVIDTLDVDKKIPVKIVGLENTESYLRQYRNVFKKLKNVSFVTLDETKAFTDYLEARAIIRLLLIEESKIVEDIVYDIDLWKTDSNYTPMFIYLL